MTKRTLRNRFITAGAVMSTLGLIFAGGLPAVAEDTLEAPWPPNGIIFGDEAPEGNDVNGDDVGGDDTTMITPTVEVTGWPDEHVFYAGETVTLNVHVDAGVVGAPSLEGMVAGLAYGGEALAFGELDGEGNALVSVRPIITGTLHFTPFFVGEGAYESATGEGGDIEVESVPVEAMLWIDWTEDDGTLIGYGGETLFANAIIEPFCVDDEDEAATDECYATYGVPTGTVAVIRDGETIGEAVVEGPRLDAAFVDVNADLSDGERADWSFVQFQVPSILLGSPESFEVTTGFESDNWFTSEVTEPVTIEVEPFQTGLALFIGDDWNQEEPIRVNAEEVFISAYFVHGDRSGATPTGTVEFFANGISIGEVTVDEDGYTDGADFLWTPIEGGEYVLKAIYTPDSLNHLGSETREYSVLVTIPPVPNPFPEGGEEADPADDPVVDDNAKTNGKAKTPQALAKTGGSSSEFAGVAGLGLLLAGAVTMILAGRKRA